MINWNRLTVKDDDGDTSEFFVIMDSDGRGEVYSKGVTADGVTWQLTKMFWPSMTKWVRDVVAVESGLSSDMFEVQERFGKFIQGEPSVPT